MKIRIQGTKEEILFGIESLKRAFGEHIQEISRHYADRNGQTYRVYIEINTSDLEQELEI